MPHKGRASPSPSDNSREIPCRLCELIPAAEGKVLFLKSPNSLPCLHKIAFGNSQVCTSRARRKVYKEQGK